MGEKFARVDASRDRGRIGQRDFPNLRFEQIGCRSDRQAGSAGATMTSELPSRSRRLLGSIKPSFWS